MTASRLILASASPRRLELLRQAGITPQAVIAPEIDETPHKAEIPALYVARMAREKALRVAQAHPSDIVLSADTVVAVGRRILPKAETADQARACLTLLSGRRHKVLTAVCGMAGDRVRAATAVSEVRFKRLSAPEMDAYLASGEWQGKAGGYAIQGAAAGLIPWISGSYSAIVGLPLFETLSILKGLGHDAGR